MLSKEEWNEKYKGNLIYFYVVMNQSNNKLSIAFTKQKKFDYEKRTDKFVCIKELTGIRFQKYDSFVNRYWEYYKTYCEKENEDL